MKSKRKRQFMWPCIVAVALAAPSLISCASDNEGMNQQRMFVSDKDFKQGRDDGRSDAKNSWTDTSSAWTWTWMMGKQYTRGYKQGWREGRAEAKFEAEKQDAEQLQKENTKK